mmetsp:Transcript_6675/g.7663  ORF Transcript_6675/g.7663 Transcript_6675/m.7663 type:complete len:250 (+) Transcript_6675:155-904(+)|eukprot:CAMPEP_0197852908 /NCGR_PEP_ID=MMETSP1438-20131217/21684_1 /TAXON_ID=1461541 /ORGANISM="Pterosperma sp., Strain CCMP1384" /LENGTH=249 /DNA_ID=CAMNT_0043467131 /DNA_START=146 /DNA_END=895 /DNA_ORIENTATION=+
MGNFVTEVLGSAVFAFTCSAVSPSIPIVQSFLKSQSVHVEDLHVIIGAFFLILTFFCTGFWGALSRGACMNPAFALANLTQGKFSPFKFVWTCVGACLGQFLGVCALAIVLQEYGYPAGARQMSPVQYGAEYNHAVGAEFVVTLLCMLVAFLIVPSLGMYGGVVNSGFYCIIMYLEGCQYSCAVTNPAAVFAQHAWHLHGIHGFQGLIHQDLWNAVAPYVIGTMSAALSASLVALALKPKKKEEKDKIL